MGIGKCAGGNHHEIETATQHRVGVVEDSTLAGAFDDQIRLVSEQVGDIGDDVDGTGQFAAGRINPIVTNQDGSNGDFACILGQFVDHHMRDRAVADKCNRFHGTPRMSLG